MGERRAIGSIAIDVGKARRTCILAFFNRFFAMIFSEEEASPCLLLDECAKESAHEG